MDRMLCTECAAVSYSAAARMLVEEGERCPKCGAPLTFEPPQPVGVTSQGDEPDDATAKT